MRNRLALIAFALMLAGCANAPMQQTPTPVSANKPPQSASGPAANDNLNAVAWTQTALEHDLIYREVFRDAGEKLRAALADPTWDALPRDERHRPPFATLKPAVIVDVDETVLDNSPYQARLIVEGKEFDESSWSEWCREKRAKPLPGAVDFAQEAARRGITVFYVSNRAEDLDTATIGNLRAAGFPVAADETVFLGLGTIVAGCDQKGSAKGCRRELVGRTHRVLMQFGDQLGDFVDVAANTPEGRRAAIEPYAGWVGERWFVLPNPMYGSFESALVGNDGRKPAETRRAAKISALQTQ